MSLLSTIILSKYIEIEEPFETNLDSGLQNKIHFFGIINAAKSREGKRGILYQHDKQA